MAHDDLRECSGWLLCAKRRCRTDLAARFPSCLFSHLESEDDELWSPELEQPAACAERGYRFLRWLWEREETEIAIVAHGGLFNHTLNDHPHVRADASAAARFGNAEWRTCTLQCGEGGDARMFTLELSQSEDG